MIGLSLIAGVQIIAIIGRIPVLNLSFPYWLFILFITLLSALTYLALRALSGELRPIYPSDRDS
jgi:uncharacterized membrane protein (DUF4010 family)